MKKKRLYFSLLLILNSFFLKAENSARKVKYKAATRIDFESLLIEGERKRPEMAVVTGNLGEKDSGLLKFREDFVDLLANDFEEVVK